MLFFNCEFNAVTGVQAKNDQPFTCLQSVIPDCRSHPIRNMRVKFVSSRSLFDTDVNRGLACAGVTVRHTQPCSVRNSKRGYSSGTVARTDLYQRLASMMTRSIWKMLLLLLLVSVLVPHGEAAVHKYTAGTSKSCKISTPGVVKYIASTHFEICDSFDCVPAVSTKRPPHWLCAVHVHH
jgi:hypothetical protein